MFTLVHTMFTVLFTLTEHTFTSVCSPVHTPLGVNSEHAERTGEMNVIRRYLIDAVDLAIRRYSGACAAVGLHWNCKVRSLNAMVAKGSRRQSLVSALSKCERAGIPALSGLLRLNLHGGFRRVWVMPGGAGTGQTTPAGRVLMHGYAHLSSGTVENRQKTAAQS